MPNDGPILAVRELTWKKVSSISKKLKKKDLIRKNKTVIIGKLEYDEDGDLLAPTPQQINTEAPARENPIDLTPGYMHKLRLSSPVLYNVQFQTEQFEKILTDTPGYTGVFHYEQGTFVGKHQQIYHYLDIVFGIEENAKKKPRKKFTFDPMKLDMSKERNANLLAAYAFGLLAIDKFRRKR